MRRALLGVVAACAVAVATLPASAGPDDVEATIHLPAPLLGTGDDPETGDAGCAPGPDCRKAAFPGLHRRLYLNSPETAQAGGTGLIGYTIRITADGVPFRLGGGAPDGADFDITFYKALGDPPNGEPDREFGDQRSMFARFGTQDETGTVPTGAQYAIVTLWGAAEARFSYTSG